MLFNAAIFLLVAGLDVNKNSRVIASQPVVEHQKEAGSGYLPGSPKYEKQEELRKAAGTKSAGVPPVSTTMKCIINLTIQYFLLYTALAVALTYNQINGSAPGLVVKTLQDATATVNFAPMLSVLFLGTRMRALQLSGGDPDKYDLPQPYVKMSMQFCAWAILGQTLMVLVLPLVTRKDEQALHDAGSGNVLESGAQSGGILGKIISATRWILMAMLYGGFTAVCIGAYSMEAPADLWAEGTAPPVSPAVACTMNLSLQFFCVYLAIAAVQTYEQFFGRSAELMKLSGVLQLAANTVNFAPMLCILFIGARMRALQIDPKFGNPQLWAQRCFYLCAYSVMVQLILVFLVPYLLGGRCVKGASEGDITFEVPNPTLFWVLTGLRYFLMLALYGGFTAVIVSVFTIEAEDPADTPPVSPAMLCVMNLTVQFFFVYLLLWVLITVKQLSLDWSMSGRTYDSFFNTAIATMEAAKSTVQFCPMLAVLFIGLRMRALQITDQKGAPQAWAQQGMYLSTYAVMLQVLMVFISPLLFGGAPKTDEFGNITSKPSNPILGYIVVFIRYLGLLCLYGGAVTMVYALFVITPETATGKGSSLIPGVDVPVPPAVGEVPEVPAVAFF
jgi:hypothetical protein